MLVSEPIRKRPATAVRKSSATKKRPVSHKSTTLKSASQVQSIKKTTIQSDRGSNVHKKSKPSKKK